MTYAHVSIDCNQTDEKGTEWNREIVEKIIQFTQQRTGQSPFPVFNVDRHWNYCDAGETIYYSKYTYE